MFKSMDLCWIAIGTHHCEKENQSLIFANNKKKDEITGNCQPRYYVGGPILDVHRSLTMFLLANVQNEDMHSSCTLF